MQFSSSRTFPGQSYCSRHFIAAVVTWMRCRSGVAVQEPVRPAWEYPNGARAATAVHGHDVQPEIQVLAECAVAILGFQIAIGGGDHAHIHFDLLITADRANFFFLQNAQQLGLHLQRQFADFIEENRAAIGRLKQSRLRA